MWTWTSLDLLGSSPTVHYQTRLQGVGGLSTEHDLNESRRNRAKTEEEEKERGKSKSGV